MDTRPDPFASLLDGPFNEVRQLPPPMSATSLVGKTSLSASAPSLVRPAGGTTLVVAGSAGGTGASVAMSPALMPIGGQTAPVLASPTSPVATLVAQPPKKREIRRLPKDVLKSGDQEQYEEWRRKQDELDRLKAIAALEEKQQQLEGAFTPHAPLQPAAAGHAQHQPRAKRDKSSGAAPPPNRIKMEVVERGVPVRKWLLIKW